MRSHDESQRFQSQAKKLVEFETVSSSTPMDKFIGENLWIERDGSAQGDIEVLEWNRKSLSRVHLPQSLFIRLWGMAQADSFKVLLQREINYFHRN